MGRIYSAHLSSFHRSLLLVIVLAVTIPGYLCIPAAPSATEHRPEPRQDLPTSTSSFNWWPYPSWGASTSTGSTTTSDTLFTATTALVDVLTSVSPDMASSTSLASPTSSTSDTLIHITALPPASSATSVSRAKSAATKGGKGFNLVYLAPLFAVLGAVAGGLCTWLLYCCAPTRGSTRQRDATLEPGPRYTPPSRFRGAATLTPGPLAEEDLTRPSQSSTRPLLEAAPAEEKKGSWIMRALSSRGRAEPVAATEERNEAEDDPFLEPTCTSGTPAGAAGGLGRQRTARTTFSQRLTSPDPYGALSDDEDLVPYETLRHKSIRRGILERLRFGTLRRAPAEYERGDTEDDIGTAGELDSTPSVREPTGKRRGHKRDSSDMKVVDSLSAARTLTAEDTPSRRPTLLRNRSDLVVSPPGFRLVVEDPISGDLMSAPSSRSTSPMRSPAKEGVPAWGWNLPWQPSPTKQRGRDDKFTALPVRRSQADKRSPYASPSPSMRELSSASGPVTPKKAENMDYISLPLSRVDSSILPASPPLVTSPPLNSQLFFGAVSPDFGSNPSLDLRLPEPARRPGARSTPDAARASGEKRNRLKTQRSPPPLPFPTTDSASPYRGHLKKTPTKKTPTKKAATPARPATVERNDSADSVDAPSAAGRGTPAQRYEARGSALTKVSEILSRGWGERQLVGSPNMGEGARSPFVGAAGSPPTRGAYLPEPLSGGPSLEKLIDEEALNGIGIEQRLGALSGHNASIHDSDQQGIGDTAEDNQNGVKKALFEGRDTNLKGENHAGGFWEREPTPEQEAHRLLPSAMLARRSVGGVLVIRHLVDLVPCVARPAYRARGRPLTHVLRRRTSVKSLRQSPRSRYVHRDRESPRPVESGDAAPTTRIRRGRILPQVHELRQRKRLGHIVGFLSIFVQLGVFTGLRYGSHWWRQWREPTGGNGPRIWETVERRGCLKGCEKLSMRTGIIAALCDGAAWAKKVASSWLEGSSSGHSSTSSSA
ncbi:hypothetical protein C2E23DRAFT_927015 [Lenzites betulinus]|nr:hypothetical protein C2E23DRAFT_927015 [Lenzites betulinus]